jgi:carbon storage regulator
MLCLTRRPNEIIRVTDKITLVVLGVEEYQVRFGIDAPNEINIVREELLNRTTQTGLPTPDNGTEKTKKECTEQEAPASEKPQPRITYKRRLIPQSSSKA